MGRTCVIEVDHVRSRFGSHIVHEDISLCVHRGEILGIVGESGSGKTTLLREMIGLLPPTEGCIRLLGKRLDELSPSEEKALRSRIGVLFQGGALFSALTVFDNIAVPMRESQLLDEDLIRELVCLKLGMVGLGAEVACMSPSELSGGMVKRAALARALALEPELLFLDEPTSGLDPIASESFVSLIRSLHQELRFTVVMVTHDLDTLYDLCDRIAVLADQTLVFLGPPSEIDSCNHPFMHAFFRARRTRDDLQARSEVT